MSLSSETVNTRSLVKKESKSNLWVKHLSKHDIYPNDCGKATLAMDYIHYINKLLMYRRSNENGISQTFSY